MLIKLFHNDALLETLQPLQRRVEPYQCWVEEEHIKANFIRARKTFPPNICSTVASSKFPSQVLKRQKLFSVNET